MRLCESYPVPQIGAELANRVHSARLETAEAQCTLDRDRHHHRWSSASARGTQEARRLRRRRLEKGESSFVSVPLWAPTRRHLKSIIQTGPIEFARQGPDRNKRPK